VTVSAVVALTVPETMNVAGLVQADVVAGGVTVASAVNVAFPPDALMSTADGPAVDDVDVEPDDDP
jgi:hypothetical protein